MKSFYLPPGERTFLHLKAPLLTLLSHEACKFSNTNITLAELWAARGAGCWLLPQVTPPQQSNCLTTQPTSTFLQ